MDQPLAPPQPDFGRHTTYQGFVIDVAQIEGGFAVVVNSPRTGEQLVFPMSIEVAETIGRRLIAPRVVLPSNGNQPH